MKASIDALVFREGYWNQGELFSSVVPLLAAGYTAKEIADMYNLHVSKVYNYLKREKHRCGVDNLTGLVGYWYSKGWLPDFRGCEWG